MSYGDCVIAEFYSQRLMIARKPHKCCETGRTILPGERYWRLTGKWDGRIDSYAQSEAAFHFARWLNHSKDSPLYMNSDGCIPFGSIRDAIGEDAEVWEQLEDEWRRVCTGEITRDTSFMRDIGTEPKR